MVRWVLIACSLALLGLGACTPPPKPAVPDIIFSGGPQFVLPAEGDVEVVEKYEPPLKAPHVEHEYGITPAEIARAWARDRIKVDPGDGTVRMTILEASVVQNELDVEKGFSGLFKDQPDRQLTAGLKKEQAKPMTMPGRLMLSGIILCWKSMTMTASRAAVKTK